MYKKIKLIIVGLVAVALSSSGVGAEDCSNFNGEMGCRSGQIATNPDDWAARIFQTPLPGDANYKKEYEGLGRIACYSHI